MAADELLKSKQRKKEIETENERKGREFNQTLTRLAALSVGPGKGGIVDRIHKKKQETEK